MLNNKKYLYIGGGIVLAIILFVGGMKVGESQAMNGKNQLGSGNSQFNQGGARTGARTVGQSQGAAGQARNRGNFINGEILSKDATSITIKLQDGGSRIVLLGTSTPVMKTSSGALSDLQVGTSISVVGNQNSDGSVTAQSIQLRPAGSAIAPQAGKAGYSGQTGPDR